jgi:23S rRNA pseudouridine1911/1915/1917 synthase
MTHGGSIIDVALGAEHFGQRLDRALADALPDLSRERIKALLRDGAVRDKIGTTVSNGSAKIAAITDLSITVPAPVALDARPEPMALNVAYEDDALIVIDKPAGLVVHPGNGNWTGTLVNALLHHCAGQLSGIGGVERPGIVHRIDKDTSGLIVAAKTDRAHEGLTRQFADHSISRRYRAIVHGLVMPPTGTVDAPLGRSSNDRLKMAVVDDSERAKRAVTHYRLVEPLREASLIECRLETGRTHQVRVHMTHIRHPLLGDPIYRLQGSRHGTLLKSLGFARQALHAAQLGFIHPISGNPVSFDSPMPTDMQELFSSLRV